MTNRTEQGSMLIYAMLVMASMLAMGLTLNSLFIGKLKSVAAARDTVASLYAADSAVERCLYEARTAADEPPLVLANGATTEVVDVTLPSVPLDHCTGLGDSFSVTATGRYRGTSRSLEISQ